MIGVNEMTKQFSNYSDLLTFTRASKGHALRPVSYGTELITNGTFDTDTTGWTASGTQSVVNGKLYWVRSSLGGVYQSITTKAGSIYVVDFTLSDSVGSVRFSPRDGSVGGTQIGNVDLNDGTRRLIFVALSSTTVLYWQNISGSGGEFYLDNVSVKEVTFDESDGTLTLFEHPENVPRVEYDADGNRLGLLVEEARTNLVVQSEFAGTWQQSPPLALNLNQGTSPDQQNNAAEVTITGGGFVYANVAVNASTQYTFSWYAKLNTATAHVYAFYDNSNNTFIERNEYTLTDGEDVGNGWYTTPSGCTSIRVYPLRETVDGGGSPTGVTGDTFIYGAQLEAGSFPTSYIKSNSGSTTTRSADVASIPVADFGYNQSAGTLFVEANAPDGSNQNRLTQLVTSGGATNRVVDLHRVTDDIVMYNGTTTMTGDAFAASHDIKAAGAYKSGDYALVSDGGSATTVSDSTVYTPDTLTIGMNGASARQLNGHIKKLMYIPRRVTNAQLISLTE
jgi:hypothetical protein